MSKQGAPMTIEALRRKAVFGRRQLVYWTAPNGQIEWAAYGRVGIKAAILSVGAKGRFYILDRSGVSSVARNLRAMLHYWRCSPD